MKKKVCLTLLVLLLLIICLHPVYADTNISDKFMPTNNPLNETKDVLYLKYDVANYALDGHYPTLHFSDDILNSVLNASFQLYAVGVKANIYLTQYAFNLDLVKDFSGILDDAVSALSKSIFWPFVPSAIILLGFWGMYRGWLKGEITSATTDIFKCIGILLLATYLMGNMGAVLTKFNGVSGDISKEILANIAQVDSGLTNKTSNGALVQFGEDVWKNFVYYPWQLMEFGEKERSNPKDDYINKLSNDFLSKAPGSDQRNALYKDTAPEFAMMREEGLGQRCFAVSIMFLTGFIYLTFVFILAGWIIIAQMTACFVAVMAPIVFLMSLWPGWGTILLQRWTMRLAGLLVTKIGLSVVLSVMLVFSTILFTKYQDRGILFVSLMQLALVVGIVLQRKKLSGLIVDTVQRGSHAAANHIYREEHHHGSGWRKAAAAGIGIAGAIVTKNPRLAAAGVGGLTRPTSVSPPPPNPNVPRPNSVLDPGPHYAHVLSGQKEQSATTEVGTGTGTPPKTKNPRIVKKGVEVPPNEMIVTPKFVDSERSGQGGNEQLRQLVREMEEIEKRAAAKRGAVEKRTVEVPVQPPKTEVKIKNPRDLYDFDFLNRDDDKK